MITNALKMRHFYKALLVFLVLTGTACSDETVVYEDGLSTELYVETNSAVSANPLHSE